MNILDCKHKFNYSYIVFQRVHCTAYNVRRTLYGEFKLCSLLSRQLQIKFSEIKNESHMNIVNTFKSFYYLNLLIFIYNLTAVWNFILTLYCELYV